MHNSCADSCAVRHVALCLCPQCAAPCFSPESRVYVCDDHVVNACQAEEQKCEEHNGMHVVNSCEADEQKCEEHNPCDARASAPSYATVPVARCVCHACGLSYENVFPLFSPVAVHVDGSETKHIILS